MKKLVLILVTICAPLLSIAHEGHGVVNTGPAHYVLTPEHILPILAVISVASYFIGKKVLKRTE